MVHRLSKQVVYKTNRKNIELDLIRRTNVLQAIRYLMDGGTDNRFNESNVGDGFRSIITDQHLRPLLTGWYITEDLHPENIFEEGNFQLIAYYLLLTYSIYSIIIRFL